MSYLHIYKVKTEIIEPNVYKYLLRIEPRLEKELEFESLKPIPTNLTLEDPTIGEIEIAKTSIQNKFALRKWVINKTLKNEQLKKQINELLSQGLNHIKKNVTALNPQLKETELRIYGIRGTPLYPHEISFSQLHNIINPEFISNLNLKQRTKPKYNNPKPIKPREKAFWKKLLKRKH